METKVCTGCGVEKPLGGFSRKTASKDGRNARCRVCENVRVAAYAVTHTEKVKAYQAAYMAAHREEARARASAWCAAHREMNKAQHATWYVAHKEEVKTYRAMHKEEIRIARAVYRAAHPEEAKELNHRRRARKLANGVFPVSLSAVRERDRMVCHLCGRKVKPEELHFDHVIPISKGGPHAEWNVRVSHAKCNLSKNNKLVGQPYLPMARYSMERSCGDD